MVDSSRCRSCLPSPAKDDKSGNSSPEITKGVPCRKAGAGMERDRGAAHTARTTSGPVRISSGQDSRLTRDHPENNLAGRMVRPMLIVHISSASTAPNGARAWNPPDVASPLNEHPIFTRQSASDPCRQIRRSWLAASTCSTTVACLARSLRSGSSTATGLGQRDSTLLSTFGKHMMRLLLGDED
ncbi:hypothetical protein AXG93_1550s1040 [Marchantia polymorpha subsp. ruderalis]|uniref:Uncharacterized protein n=1 Tax=Marchantia polymorpha subsp. ruderalis TaxID=1480154 RepID=A0A176WQ02_MARPO|nr:hypothetical protein AXG93_1550s1040 [Marchantia polymorpha subsp. ruderalis]